MTSTLPDRAALQRRVLVVLAAAQILSSASITAGVTVGPLLVRDLAGAERWAGLAGAALTLGSAFAALPLARRAAHRGRRPALGSGYLLAGAGALTVAVGAIAGALPVVIVGIVGVGVGQASNFQARFAAADLATPEERARAIALVVWSTTVGAVTGPLTVGATTSVAESLGWREQAGPYLTSAVLFGVASVVVAAFLRPDPLTVAGGGAEPVPRRPVPEVLRVLAADRRAALAVGAVVVAHLAMVGVMSMTPLHLEDGGHGVEVVGIVISVHVAGMYAFSPISGALADRLGREPTLALGAALLLLATSTSGHTAGTESGMMTFALFLLGLGWSLCLVAGSALLVDAVPDEIRVDAQGTTDLAMSVAGGVAAISSGLIVDAAGFHQLSHIALVPVALVLGAALVATVGPMRRPDTVR